MIEEAGGRAADPGRRKPCIGTTGGGTVGALTGVEYALRPGIPDQMVLLSPMQVVVVAPLSVQTRKLAHESGVDYPYGLP